MGHYICPIFMYYINRARVGIPEVLRPDICYPVSPIPIVFHSMTPLLNQDQLDSIIDQFAEIIVDGMDTKTLAQYVYDDLVDYYSDLTQDELQDFIEQHDEDLWKELVDNETTDIKPVDPKTYTYGLDEGESISFPVHGT